MNTNSTPHATLIQHHSLRVEAALRHAFLADLYSYLWTVDPVISLQVFTADIDDQGFDLLLTANQRIRHVQLKSSFVGSTTKNIRLRDSLFEQKGGCVLGCHFSRESLRIQHYSFWGYTHDKETADLKLYPNARSIKANAKGERKILPGVRLLSWNNLHQNLNISTVALCLFGIQKPSKLVL